MVHVVLLLGAEGVGKSTIASHMTTYHGYIELTFAGALRQVATHAWNDIATMVNLPHITVDDTLERTKKETQIEQYELAGRKLTPRWLIQWFGTEIIRKHLDENVWANAVVEQMKKYIENGYTKFIISDYRFENEGKCVVSYLQTICNASWMTATIVRGDIMLHELIEMQQKALQGHESQRGWVTLHSDIEIKNPFSNTDIWLAMVAHKLNTSFHTSSVNK